MKENEKELSVELKEQEKPKILFNPELIPDEIKGVKLSPTSKKLLSQGCWSELIVGMHEGNTLLRDAKIQMYQAPDGEIKFNYKFKQEQLVIPSKIGDFELTDEHKRKLSNNEAIGPFYHNKTELYLQVDKELNAVTVRNANGMDVSQIIQAKYDKEGSFRIGEYELTPKEIDELIHGKELKTHVFEKNGHFFTAEVALTHDKKGITFNHVKTVPNHLVNEYKEKFNQNGIDIRSAINVAADITSLENKNEKVDIINPNINAATEITTDVTNEKVNVINHNINPETQITPNVTDNAKLPLIEEVENKNFSKALEIVHNLKNENPTNLLNTLIENKEIYKEKILSFENEIKSISKEDPLNKSGKIGEIGDEIKEINGYISKLSYFENYVCNNLNSITPSDNELFVKGVIKGDMNLLVNLNEKGYVPSKDQIQFVKLTDKIVPEQKDYIFALYQIKEDKEISKNISSDSSSLDKNISKTTEKNIEPSL